MKLFVNLSDISSMNQKYTAAIIGTGRIGFSLGFDKKREQPASHTMALLDNKNIDLVAGCDADQKNLEEFGKYAVKHGSNIKLYSSLEDFFADFTDLPDIVTIAVNEDSHLSAALKVIEKRPRLVILEKPVALSMKEGDLIKQASEEYQVPVMINHERRFAKDYNFAKDYLKRIGKLITVNARLDSGLRVYSSDTECNGEYSLLHDGTHLVDIVLFLLDQNSLDNVKLIGFTRDDKDEKVIRAINVHGNCAACNDVNLNISGGSRYFGFEVELIGSLGKIRIGNGIFEFYQRQESKLYTGFYSLMPDKKVPKIRKTGYFANMVQNAVDYLNGTDELHSPLQTGLNTLSILENIKNQLVEGMDS